MRHAFLILLFAAYVNALNRTDLLWYTPVGGTNTSTTVLRTDRSGNIYVGGSFTGTATFGSSNIASAGPQNPFIAKYSPDGEALWVKIPAWTNSVKVTDILALPGGEFVASANCSLVSSLDSMTIVTNQSACALRYERDGTPRWIVQARCSPAFEGIFLAADSATNIYIACGFGKEFSLGPTNLTNTGLSAAAVAKLSSSDGAVQWARMISSRNIMRPHGFRSDLEGNLYYAGHFTPNINFGTVEFLNRGTGYDVFVVSYGSQGALRWSAQAGGKENDEGWALDVDRAGHVALIGGFTGPIQFPDRVLTNTSTGDLFVAQFLFDGTPRWITQAGINKLGVPVTPSAFDPLGNLIVGGLFGATAQLGMTNLTRSNGNCFVAKFSPDGDVKDVFQCSNLENLTTDTGGNLLLLTRGANLGGIAISNISTILAKIGTAEVPLKTARLGGNLELEWSSLATGFILESTEGLGATNWTEIPTNAVIESEEWGPRASVTVSPTEANRFFRLRRSNGEAR